MHRIRRGANQLLAARDDDSGEGRISRTGRLGSFNTPPGELELRQARRRDFLQARGDHAARLINELIVKLLAAGKLKRARQFVLIYDHEGESGHGRLPMR